jgi:hypothetical protein
MRVQSIDSFFSLNAEPPTDPAEYRAWLNMADVGAFLADSTEGDVPVLIINSRFFLYAAFVPRRKLGKRYVTDLLEWNLSVSAGWGYGYGWNQTTGELEPFVGAPLDGTGTRSLEGAEPVVFVRDIFESSDSQYLELNQRFAHISNVHLVAQKQAYCQVDTNGDLKSVVTLRKEPGNTLCTVTRDLLDFYMYLTDSVLVRVFEVNRFRDRPVRPEPATMRLVHDTDHDVHARLVLIDEHGPNLSSYLRGFQVIRNMRPVEEMQRRLRGEPVEGRQYATFLAFDFKHDEVRECSCDPEQLGNYFVESDLPFETSPAFFRPDVLNKYKLDPDKYTFGYRSITCRASWSLKYDINEAGQVHAYLIDLARLPYQEQLHWKAANVPPEGSISERAFRNDFKGEWFSADDPLEDLKRHLIEFPKAEQQGREVAIWAASEDAKARGFPRLTYVVTESTKEWEDQILELNKVLVEGFKKPALKLAAKALGADDDTTAQFGTLRLLRFCLEKRGVEPEVINDSVGPLQELNDLRSAGGVAHTGTRKVDQDQREHYRALLRACDGAMESLAAFVRAGMFNVA